MRPRRWVAALVSVWLLTGCTSSQRAGTEPEPSPSTESSASTAPAYPDMPTWRPVDVLETPRDDFVTAVVDGRIWILGGMTGDRGNRLTSIEVFDPATETWTTSKVEVPVGLASFEGVAVGRKIYVFGGLTVGSRASDFAAVLDTSTGRWKRLPALPHARYAHTVTLHDGRVYVVGGEAVSGAVPEVDVFDLATQRWSQGAALPQARGSHDTVAVPGGLYVLGGWLDGGPTDLVQRYDPRRDTWSEGPALPEPISRGGAAVVDDQVWVSFHEVGAVLDLGTGEWAPANHPPLSRHGHGFVALDGAIYAIGGCQEWPLRDVRTVDVMEVS